VAVCYGDGLPAGRHADRPLCSAGVLACILVRLFFRSVSPQAHPGKLWKSKSGSGSQSKSDIQNQLLLDPDLDCDSNVTGDG